MSDTSDKPSNPPPRRSGVDPKLLEILVCPATMPPWTPLFGLAKAVVTDHGGILSHTAIVAREYRIPAVVGTKIATTTVRDGQTITVDGAAGTVRLED